MTTVEIPTKKNSFCVIVTFFPKKPLFQLVEEVLKQVATVIIVDNTGDETSIELLENLKKDFNFHLIKNEKNLGIATALNQGVKFGLNLGFSWALTMDQDSVLIENLIEEYADISLICKDNISIFGCNYIDSNVGKNLMVNKSDYLERFKFVKTAITAGTLIHKATFEKIGFFRDDFFIDYVDHEYCFRARKNGLKIVAGTKPLMIQSIGEQKETKSGILRHYYDHPPFRNYFIARNTVKVIKMYYSFDSKECTFHARALFFKNLTLIFRENNKLRKLFGFWKGIIHGIFWIR